MVGTIMFHCGRALEYLRMFDNTFTAIPATFGHVLVMMDLVVGLDDDLTVSNGLYQRWSWEKWYKR